ncbi:hypothetical protein EBR66_02485 [bacterium]|nr:hypothetical protein [bacterium]
MGTFTEGIRMDAYWNYVGTPFLFCVIGFGMFVLFQSSELQLASQDYIHKEVRKLQQGRQRTPVARVIQPTAK